MLANPDKFQALILERNFRNPTETIELHIRDNGIIPEPEVKLFGFLLDNM